MICITYHFLCVINFSIWCRIHLFNKELYQLSSTMNKILSSGKDQMKITILFTSGKSVIKIKINHSGSKETILNYP